MTERAERLARNLRRQLELTGPPFPSNALLSVVPHLVVWHEELPSLWCGLSLPLDGQVVVVLPLHLGHLAWRWALAHQLAHGLLRPRLTVCRLASDLETYVREREADAFGQALLVPRSWLRRDVAQSGPQAAPLAERYQVPLPVMVQRLDELGLRVA